MNYIAVGTTRTGRLQVIPITGGTIYGEKIAGKVVLCGEEDWNVAHQDDIAHVFAKSLLETDVDKFIAIENEGPIDSGSDTDIKTMPIISANNTGKYLDLTTASMWAISLDRQTQSMALIFSFTIYGDRFRFFIRSR
jgi:hypothetical protein